MVSSSAQGNAPERWQKFLTCLDEKLQFGLLEHLRKIKGYHFEADVLYLEPFTAEDGKALSRQPVFQQLQILAQDAIGVSTVKIK